MAKYLINTVETYRVDNEDEAKAFVEKLKNEDGEVLKHSIEYKEQKSKGEVIQSWYRLIVKRQYNNEKEPDTEYQEENE
jgi:hypothetical protein